MRVIDYFDKGSVANSDRIAVTDEQRSYTYAEATTVSRHLASAMLMAGIKPGEPVAIFSQNDARVLLCMLAVFRVGAVWIPVNYRESLETIGDFLAYSDTGWLFYQRQFAEKVRGIRRRVPTLHRFICIDGDDQGAEALEEVLKRGAGGPELDWDDPFGSPERLMAIIPTGGTTGASKGVRMTNLAWGTMTEIALSIWRRDEVTPVCLSVAPLTHAAGVVAMTLFGLGATNVVIGAFDATKVMESIQHHCVTHLFLPPTAYYALLAHPKVRTFDYSTLTFLIVGAAPVSPEMLKRGVEIFGPCICQCFGQTEAPMLLTWLDPQTVAQAAAGHHPERLYSCGKATAPVRIGIMDDNGQLVSAGERGEVVVRGSLVTPGYYNLPQATREIRAFGWHHTGDIGYLDEDGFLYLVDRKKDMIISGGFNVYSSEVEATIAQIPQILECAVIGVPDDKWGEAVKAFVACHESMEVGDQQIIDHCRERLGGVKAPKSVEFLPALPKTPNGKVDKRALRARFWARQTRAVH
jgi:fatty-acyl-CoA synthase